MPTTLFPRKGDRLRAHSVFFQATRVAASGIGIMSGMVPSRASSSSVAVSAGTYRNVNAVGAYAGGSLTGIPIASPGMLRFDLIVYDVSDTTLKRIAGTEDTPTVISDFLENAQPLPPELASASQILLGIARVSNSGIENIVYGHYSTGGIANLGIVLPSPLPASTAVQFAATTKILGRKTAGAGAGEECTLSEILDFVGSPAQGDILYRGASAWSRLAKGALGYVLSQGANDPAWAVDPFTALLTTRGQIPYRGASAPAALAKGTAGQVLVQGANDPAWTTCPFNVAFAFGDGISVLLASACAYPIPIASKIVAAQIRSFDSTGAPLAGSVTCTLYKHARGAARGTLVDAFAISTATDMKETGLNIAVAADDYLTIVLSGIATVKQIVCTLTLEPT